MAASALVDSSTHVFKATNNAAFYGNSFTLSIWYKLRTDPAGGVYAAGNRNASTAGYNFHSSFGSGVDDLKDGVTMVASGGALVNKDATARTVNTWNFIAFTFDSTANQLKLYWGNESTSPSLIATVVSSGTMSSDVSDLWFGGNPNDPTTFGNQLVSDLRIYNATVRTLSALQSDYLKRLVGNETGLTDYWKLNDGSGNTAVNSTSARNATATTGSWIADEPAFSTGAAINGGGFLYNLF